MQLRSLDIKGLFFVALLLCLAVVMLRLFSPFMDIIIVAIVISQLFHPVYKAILSKVKIDGIASTITTVLALLLTILPIIVIGFLAVFEIAGVINSLPSTDTSVSQYVLGENTTAEVVITEQQEKPDPLTRLELMINNFLTGLDQNLANSGIDLKQLLVDADLVEDSEDEVLRVNLNNLTKQSLGTIQQNIAPILSGIVSGGLNVLFFGFLLIVTLIYLFSEYERLPDYISKISPLEDGLDKLLFQKFTDTNRAVILGSLAVAICQATAVSAMLLLFGIGAPILLWLIMVILSIIPVGSGVVWFPVGLVLMLTGRPIEGIILIVYSAIIINVIDTLLRPRIMKHNVKLHPLVIIFSALGGISAFGPLGILYGPVIAVFFTSLMEIYVERYSSKAKA